MGFALDHFAFLGNEGVNLRVGVDEGAKILGKGF